MALRVFISANPEDLKSAREKLWDSLTINGYDPQTSPGYPLEYSRARQMLKTRIGKCDVLIHLVGMRFGEEPDPKTVPGSQPRRSSAQMEVAMARELKKPVITFLCGENFSYDHPGPFPELPDKKRLQMAYRDSLGESARGLFLVDSFEDLAEKFKVAEKGLRRKKSAKMTVVSLMVVVAVLIGKTFVLPVTIGFQAGLEPNQPDPAPQTLVPLQKGKAVSLPADMAARLEGYVRAKAEQKLAGARSQGNDPVTIYEIRKRLDYELDAVPTTVDFLTYILGQNPTYVYEDAAEALADEGLDQAIAVVQYRSSQLRYDVETLQQLQATQSLNYYRTLETLLLEGALQELALDWEAALETYLDIVDLAPDWSQIRLTTGTLLYQLGRYAEAMPHLRAAQQLAKTDHVRYLAARYLGLCYQETGDLDEADKAIQLQLKFANQLFGPTSAQFVNALSDRGFLLMKRGDYAEAEKQFRAVVDINRGFEERILVRAVNLNNLAVVCGLQGKNQEAEDLFLESLGIDLAHFGPNHEAVVRDTNNLGDLYLKMGRFDEAAKCLEEVRPTGEEILPPGHEINIKILSNLGLAYQNQGRIEKAQVLLERALELSEQSLDAGNPEIALRQGNLAYNYLKQGRLEEAGELYEKAVSLCERQTGPDHPNLALLLRGQGTLFTAQERYELADQTLQRALGISEKALGPQHLDVAWGLGNLGELRWRQGRIKEARSYYERCLAIVLTQPGGPAAAETFVPDYLELLESEFGLKKAAAQRQLERLKVKAVAEREAKDLKGEEFPPSKSVPLKDEDKEPAQSAPGTKSQEDLASDLLEEGISLISATRAEEALVPLNKALAIYRKSRSADDPKLGECLYRLALTYQILARDAEAEPLLREALALALKSSDEGSMKVTQLKKSLADALFYQKKFEEAEPLLEEVIASVERLFGDDDFLLSGPLLTLGMLQLLQRQYQEAIASLERSLEIREASYGEDDPSNASHHYYLGLAQLGLSHVDKGRSQLERAIYLEAKDGEHEQDNPKYAEDLVFVLRTIDGLSEKEAAAEIARIRAKAQN